METSPAGSESLSPDPAREWQGTLVTEFRDWGPPRKYGWKSQALFIVPAAAVILWVGLVLGRDAFAGLVLVGGPVMLGANWLWMSEFSTNQTTLSLDPDVLRLRRISRNADVTTELRSDEAGVLSRWFGNSKGSVTAYKVQLQDNTGRVRMELFCRSVRIPSAVGGRDSSTQTADMLVPLAVLIGTWWPDQNRRVTRNNLFLGGILGRDPDCPWGLPNLDAYPIADGKGSAEADIFFIGIGVVFGAFAAIAAFLLRTKPETPQMQAGAAIIAVAFGLASAVMVLVGLWWLREDRPQKK